MPYCSISSRICENGEQRGTFSRDIFVLYAGFQTGTYNKRILDRQFLHIFRFRVQYWIQRGMPTIWTRHWDKWVVMKNNVDWTLVTEITIHHGIPLIIHSSTRSNAFYRSDGKRPCLKFLFLDLSGGECVCLGQDGDDVHLLVKGFHELHIQRPQTRKDTQ